jgi:hypothetical protein
MAKKRHEKSPPADPAHGLSKERLNELIWEATADAHDESEQAMGFHAVLEDELALPFDTEMLGTTVTVESIGFTEDDERLVAVCRKGKARQRISLADLPLPTPLPQGAEWIVAYRYWCDRM